MLVNKLTGEVFTDRKEAKKKMGHANFNRAVKNGNIRITMVNPLEVAI